jgi:PKD repeat protein
MNKRAISLRIPLLVIVGFCVISLFNIAAVFPQERHAGVKAGDWAKYKVFSLSWKGPALDYNLTEAYPDWIKNTVQNPPPSEGGSLGGLVYYNTLRHWINGTEKTYTSWIYIIQDPMDGSFGDSYGGFHHLDFIAAHLNLGDIVADTPTYGGSHFIGYIKEWKINETVSRTYLGTNRDINYLNVTYSPNPNYIFYSNYFWDRQSGILTEFVQNEVYNEGQLSFSYKIVDTNLWGDKTSPTADFDYVASGLSVAFDASASSDNVGIVNYEWTFGDGNSGMGKTFTHTYSSAGTYEVTLTVKDAAGNSNTASINVNVTSSGALQLWIFSPIGLVLTIGLIFLVALIVLGAFLFWRRQRQKSNNVKLTVMLSAYIKLATTRLFGKVYLAQFFPPRFLKFGFFPVFILGSESVWQTCSLMMSVM